MATQTNNGSISETGVSFSADTFFNRVSSLIEAWKEVFKNKIIKLCVSKEIF